MTIAEALKAIATPPPEPFRQVAFSAEDNVRWQEWNDRRLEALKVARAL